MQRLLAAGLLLWLAMPAVGGAQSPVQRPTFKGGADLVAVTAIVRRKNGQPVTTLRRDDFELLDSGHARPIVDLQYESAPISLALLVDQSGSMDVAARRVAVRDMTNFLLGELTPDTDEIGLFSFDTRLLELQPLEPAPGDVLAKLETLRPFGSTSLYDAIAETGRRLAAKGRTRRAVVALTDGWDNYSRMSASEVSAIASAIDVPVYIVVVISPFDRPDSTVATRAQAEAQNSRLADLARWTGGEMFVATGPSQASLAARQIASDLRHQYLIAFEPDPLPGWHPIEIHTRDRELIVRARSGYTVQSPGVGLQQ